MPEQKVVNQDTKDSQSQDSIQQTNSQVGQVTDPNTNDDPNNDNNSNNNNNDAEYVARLEERLALQQISHRRLEQLVEGLSKNNNNNIPTPPPPRDVKVEREKFYNDPVGVLNDRDQRILSEMQKMLEPLKEVASSFKATSQYDTLKTIVKRDPIFGKGLQDPEIEAMVDQTMRSMSPESITEDNIKSAVAQAYGIKSMGGFGSGNGNRRTPNPQNDNIRTDPPQLPTSRTRVSTPETRTKELTEDDRIAMRYAGLKPGNPEHEKEYWNLISDETMTLSVHKKPEGKK